LAWTISGIGPFRGGSGGGASSSSSASATSFFVLRALLPLPSRRAKSGLLFRGGLAVAVLVLVLGLVLVVVLVLEVLEDLFVRFDRLRRLHLARGRLLVRARRLLPRALAGARRGAVRVDAERVVERGVELGLRGRRVVVLVVVRIRLRATLRGSPRGRRTAAAPRQRGEQPAARVEPAQRRLGRAGVEQVGVEDERQQEHHRERDPSAEDAESAIVLQQRREGDAEVAARIGDPGAASAEDVGQHRRQRRAEEEDADGAHPDRPSGGAAHEPRPLAEQRERNQEGGVTEVREQQARAVEADGATDVVPAGHRVARDALRRVLPEILAVRRHRAEQEEPGAEPRDGGKWNRTLALHARAPAPTKTRGQGTRLPPPRLPPVGAGY
jgi:hypothetical protein